jgi:hypothetical protein
MRAQLGTPQQVMFECCEQRLALHAEGLDWTIADYQESFFF